MRGVETKWEERPDSSSSLQGGPEEVTQRGGKFEGQERIVEVPARQSGARCEVLVIEEGGVQPGLREQSHGAKHSREITSLSPRLSGTVNCHLDGFVISGHLHRLSVDGDAYCEALPSAATAHKPQVRELCELVLHDGRAVPDLPTPVVVIAALDSDGGPVRHLLTTHWSLRQSDCHVTLPGM